MYTGLRLLAFHYSMHGRYVHGTCCYSRVLKPIDGPYGTCCNQLLFCAIHTPIRHF